MSIHFDNQNMTSLNPHIPASCPKSDQAGFTLVEIMVGLTIGMLATLVIMQVFAVFEQQKRATTGTADALTSGNIALFKLGREMEIAGYGLVPTSPTKTPLMCAVMAIDPLVSTYVTGITPVTITDGGFGSDSILIRYGDSLMGGANTEIGTVIGNDVWVKSNLGCSQNDVTLVIDPSGTLCGISRVTAGVLPPAAPALPPAPIAPVPLGKITLNSTVNAVGKGALSCLGLWHEVTYAVSGVDMIRQDLSDIVPPGPGVAAINPIAANIVNIQAQYGVSLAPRQNTVNQWVDATGMWTPAAMTVTNRNRIKAVRIAVVARDPKMEANIVTDPCNPATNSGLCAWAGSASSPAPAINLGGVDPDWRNYHYRVFETIIPLRNVIWAQPTLQP